MGNSLSEGCGSTTAGSDETMSVLNPSPNAIPQIDHSYTQEIGTTTTVTANLSTGPAPAPDPSHHTAPSAPAQDTQRDSDHHLTPNPELQIELYDPDVVC
jgi:hypothetical protein